MNVLNYARRCVISFVARSLYRQKKGRSLHESSMGFPSYGPPAIIRYEVVDAIKTALARLDLENISERNNDESIENEVMQYACC